MLRVKRRGVGAIERHVTQVPERGERVGAQEISPETNHKNPGKKRAQIERKKNFALLTNFEAS